jgi:tetratricopeptide (TPR) repeat protein
MTRNAVLMVAILAFVLGGCSQRPRDLRRDGAVEPAGTRVVDYSVQEDDSWNSIAESFFGSARNASRIATDNLDLGLQPRPGTVVRVRVLDEEFDLVRGIAEARGSYNQGVESMALEGGDADARAAFERAVERAPHFVDARYNLALVLLRVGEPQSALEQLSVVAAARPDDADTAYAVGAAWFHAGEFSRAAAELERALDLQPELLRARYTYALALERLGRILDARRAFRAYLSRDDESAWAAEARVHLQELERGG